MLSSLLLALVLVGISLNAFANTLKFVPRIEMGFDEYSISFSGLIPFPTGVQESRFAFHTESFSYRFGATGIYGDFFVDAYHQISSEDSTVQLFPQLGAAETWQAKKTESNFTLGYSVLSQVNIFVGYRRQKQTGKGISNSSYEFKHAGYFIGSSYGWGITEQSTVALNAGYSRVDSTIDEKLFGFELPKSRGDGTGLKFGISFRGQLTENFGYSFSLDRYRYDHKLKNRNSGIDVKAQEEETYLRFGINYIF